MDLARTLACCLLPLLLREAGPDHVQKESGKTGVVIVQSARPTEAESFAAGELARFLGRITGAEVRMTREADS